MLHGADPFNLHLLGGWAGVGGELVHVQPRGSDALFIVI